MYKYCVPKKEGDMSIETTYSEVRAKLADFMNLTITDNEIVVIKRRGKEPVALIAEAELRGLEETAHLLRSPRNAERLQKALQKAQAGKGKPLTLEALRHRVGIDD
jgi:antitoxin YefM